MRAPRCSLGNHHFDGMVGLHMGSILQHRILLRSILLQHKSRNVQPTGLDEYRKGCEKPGP
jgi:hypothetical protein